jgi:hypothetical protein
MYVVNIPNIIRQVAQVARYVTILVSNVMVHNKLTVWPVKKIMNSLTDMEKEPVKPQPNPAILSNVLKDLKKLTMNTVFLTNSHSIPVTPKNSKTMTMTSQLVWFKIPIFSTLPTVHSQNVTL